MNARCLSVVLFLAAFDAVAQSVVLGSFGAELSVSEAPSPPMEWLTGTVVEGQVHAWTLAVTQLVTRPPEDPNGAPLFEPGLKAAHALSPIFSLGAEYVATLGAVSWLAGPAEQSHRLFAAAELGLAPGCQLGVALGYDVTGPEGWVGRLLLDFDVDRLSNAVR